MPARRARPLLAVAGAVAALVGLAAGEAAAVVLGSAASPLVAVSGAVVDLSPGWAKEAVIALFGTGDKPFLLILLGVLLAGLGAGAALLEARRPGGGRALAGVIGLVGVLAAVTRPDAGLLTPLPAAVATVVAALLLPALVRRAQSPAVTADADPTGRRRFLVAMGVGAVASGVVVALGQAAAQAGRRVADARALVRLPAPAVAGAAVPASASVGITGVAPFITPTADFYRIDTAFAVPELAVDDWSLEITGLVRNPITISWSDLVALPLEEHVVTLMCVSNEVGGELIGTSRWLGYPIRDLLARAEPEEGADMVLSTSEDGWTAGTPLEALRDPDRAAIVAIGMDGEPLPVEHGFPARLVVPGLYGYVSATKWVRRLEVTRFDRATAYWTDRGWGERGPIKLSSRIDVPGRGERVTAGGAVVAGVAWCQHIGVSRVQVRADGGAWQEAVLGDEPTVDAWRQWRAAIDLVAGDHLLEVRAFDAEGRAQDETVRDVLPDGATGLHSVRVSVG